MRFRVLDCDSKKDKKYIGKEFTITDGFVHPPFRHDYKEPRPLEQSEWFNATDGQAEYELLDIRKKLAPAIAAKAMGEMEMHIGISTNRRLPMAYTCRICILGHDY